MIRSELSRRPHAGFSAVFWLLSLVCLTTGCYTRQIPVEEEPPAAEDAIPELEYVVISYSNTLECQGNQENERLFLLDSRAYYDQEGVQRVCMRFRSQRIVEVLEARDIIVHVVEGFLKRVNNDPILPLYIADFPLSPENLCINIEFESYFIKFIDPLYVARVTLQCGIVYYYAYNAIDPETTIWCQRIEPYEKAYRFSLFKHMDDNLRKPLGHQVTLPYEEFAPLPHLPTAQPNEGPLPAQVFENRGPSHPKLSKYERTSPKSPVTITPPTYTPVSAPTPPPSTGGH